MKPNARAGWRLAGGLRRRGPRARAPRPRWSPRASGLGLGPARGESPRSARLLPRRRPVPAAGSRLVLGRRGVLGSYYQPTTKSQPAAPAARRGAAPCRMRRPHGACDETKMMEMADASRPSRTRIAPVRRMKFPVAGRVSRGSFPRIRTEKRALTWATHTRTTSMASTRRRHRAAHIGACGLGSIGRRFLKLRPRRHHGPPHAGPHQRSRWLTRAQTPRCARPPLPHQRRGSRVCSRVDRNSVSVLTLRAHRPRCWRPHSWPRRSA